MKSEHMCYNSSDIINQLGIGSAARKVVILTTFPSPINRSRSGGDKMKKQTPREYILTRISIDETSGCWNWTAGIGRGGYGRAKHNRQEYKAHRYSYQVFVGEIPDDKILCHKCDNPRCVNPAHVYVGTHKDNSHDRMARGRYKNGRTKLAPEDYGEIRILYNEGVGPKAIAAEYGITPSSVYRIIHNQVSPDYTYQPVRQLNKVFSEKDVRLIRKMRWEGHSYGEIQKIIPRDHRSLWEIANNKIYKE